tara:strand:- start:49869 stop:50615 length:747 start_codon:yes stop_codon:yes gene_type:complete
MQWRRRVGDDCRPLAAGFIPGSACQAGLPISSRACDHSNGGKSMAIKGTLSRRSFLGRVAGGVAATGAMAAVNGGALAQTYTGRSDSDGGASADPAGYGRGGSGVSDSDSGGSADPAGQGRGGRGQASTGVTDNDSGSAADPAGNGRSGRAQAANPAPASNSAPASNPAPNPAPAANRDAENARITAENARIEAENRQIEAMRQEQARLQQELQSLGGGKPNRRWSSLPGQLLVLCPRFLTRRDTHLP